MCRPLFILVIILIGFGCSKPLEKPYTEETADEDIQEMLDNGTIDSTELMTMAAYMMIAAMQDENIEGKTYSEILEKGKAWQAEKEEEERKQKELAEQAKREEEARTKRLREALRVTIYDKGYNEYDYQEYLTYKFVFENLTDKEIRAFKGVVMITDLFDDEIKSIPLTYDDRIQANEKVNWNGQTEYNQFIDSDVKIRNKDMDDLKVVWKPEQILFTDGTKLE